MTAGLTFVIAVKTPGGDNSRGHWAKAHRRQIVAKAAVIAACRSYQLEKGASLRDLLRKMAEMGPLDVRVVRLYDGHRERRCDPHNLGSRLKGIIDGLAKVFGIDDGDPHIRYLPDQERAKMAGVRVEVGPRAKVLPWPPWTAVEWQEVARCLRLTGVGVRPPAMAREAEDMAAALEDA